MAIRLDIRIILNYNRFVHFWTDFRFAQSERGLVMRIQLCKNRYMAVEEFRADLDAARRELKPSCAYHEISIRPSSAIAEAYLCPHCGTEFFRHYCCYGEFLTGGNDHNLKFYTAKGQEIIRKISSKLKTRRQQIMDDFKQSELPKICPVCGMPLNNVPCGKKRGEWRYNLGVSIKTGCERIDDEREYNWLIDSAFKELSHVIQKNREKQVKHELFQLYGDAMHCDKPDVEFSTSERQEIQSSPDELKNYIYNLLQLYSSEETLKTHLSSLYAARIKNQAEVNIVNSKPLIERKERIAVDIERFEKSRKVYLQSVAFVDSCKANKPKPVQLPIPPKPVEPVYQKPNLFNKKRVLEQNAQQKKAYLLEIEKYECKCQEVRAETEKRNSNAQKAYCVKVQQAEEAMQKAEQEMNFLRVNSDDYVASAPVEVCPEKAKQTMIEEEIKNAEMLFKKLHKIMVAMHSANVIYEKYWDIEAIAAFYEYLMSGRCTSLEGTNGAYNLYEAEKRSDVMITKLSGIESALKRIECSQYRIAAQLESINYSLKEMNETMDAAYNAITDIRETGHSMAEYMKHISENSDVMAHNSAVTAYYSKINASLTDALCFMVALK